MEYDEEVERYMSDPKAKSLSALIEAATILGLSENEEIIGAGEHDIVYFNNNIDVDPESPEGYRLKELGFHYQDDSWSWFV